MNLDYTAEVRDICAAIYEGAGMFDARDRAALEAAVEAGLVKRETRHTFALTCGGYNLGKAQSAIDWED